MKEWFKKLIFLLSLPIFLASFLYAQSARNSCLSCHLELEGSLAAPAQSFSRDIHAQFGLSCASCHGGNPLKEEIEEAKDRSFKGKFSRQAIPQLCASCHADANYMRNYNPSIRVDQFELYLTSRHGQAYKKGDLKAAICTDCHGVHQIQRANMPQSSIFPWNLASTCSRCHSDPDLMKPYGLATNQAEDYRASVHARSLYEKKDLSAPTCNDCHGNHGALPPGVSSVANVCRQCHPSQAELFTQSPHKKAFDEARISECEACHGNHRIISPSAEMLAGGKQDLCLQCHSSDSSLYQQASKLREKFNSLQNQIESLSSRLNQVKKKGVEMSEARYELQQAHSFFLEARNLIHGLSFPEIEEKIKATSDKLNLVDNLVLAAEKEIRYRKTGLVIATAFLFLLALALLLKVRERRNRV
jgi:predicted CXXCH cytochrome family protein